MAVLASRYLAPVALAFAALTGIPALAQTPPALPTVDLAAEASRRAPNDLATAAVYAEATDPDPTRLARRVNETVAAALTQARHYPDVRTRTSSVSTWPVYGKDGRRIEGWRMRSEIHLESRKLDALSELLGKLQTNLVVGQLVLQPAPETYRETADQAASDAIRAFEARAAAVAATLGKRHRLRHLSVGYGGTPGPIRPMMRAAAMAAEAAPPPMEAGESDVTVTVSGTIELTD